MQIKVGLERINSFLIYLMLKGSLSEKMCHRQSVLENNSETFDTDELEFTIKRILGEDLMTLSNGIFYPNQNTKRHVFSL